MTIKQAKTLQVEKDCMYTAIGFGEYDDDYILRMSTEIIDHCLSKRVTEPIIIEYMINSIYGRIKRTKIEYFMKVYQAIKTNSKPSDYKETVLLAWNSILKHFGWPCDNVRVLPGSVYSGRRR